MTKNDGSICIFVVIFAVMIGIIFGANIGGLFFGQAIAGILVGAMAGFIISINWCAVNFRTRRENHG